MTPRQRNIFAAIAVLAAVGGYGFGRWLKPEPATLRDATVLPAPRVLPPATLDLGAQQASLADPAGRWTVLFLGFTHCPDVCPTTLALVARAVGSMPEARRPRVVFLSVDPERDAQPKAAEYARWYGPAFLGATSPELPALAAALGAPYARVDGADGYSMDHPGALFLLDPQGRFAAVVTPPLDAASLAADLGVLTAAP